MGTSPSPRETLSPHEPPHESPVTNDASSPHDSPSVPGPRSRSRTGSSSGDGSSRASDLARAVETRGIEPVPDHERGGRVRELFPTWVAANISVLLLTMGAGLVVFNRLNLWQVLLVGACAAVVSYGMVGLLSVSGKWGGAPGLMLSRATFGVRGNYFPGAVIWVARFGWETINAVTGAYALLTVLDLVFGVRSGPVLIAVTLVAFVACTFLVSGMGRTVLRVCNTWSTYLFAAFSVLVLGHLVTHVDWGRVVSRPAGGTAQLIAGIGTIAAGGISWVPSGPDFTRYLPHRASGRRITGTTVAGAGIVVVPLVAMGAVMAVVTPGLASAKDPVSFLGEVLPTWLAVPYLLTALAGMLLINSLSMYSAGFTAQTMGVRLPRALAVSVNAVISLIGGLLLMLVAQSFLGSFIAFLTLLAVSFSAWIGVYAVDMARRRRRPVRYDAAGLTDTGRTSRYWYLGGFCWQALTAWAGALAVGVCLTKIEWFTGPLATTWVGRNGLGWAATIALAAVLFAVLPAPRENARSETEPAENAPSETEPDETEPSENAPRD